MIKWHLEVRYLKDLKPHGKNPRQLSKDQERNLAGSIEKYGMADKPIINTDGAIIGGHMRINYLKKQKIPNIECWVPDRELNQNEVDELNIRLNKNTGDWDWDVLANEWNVVDLINWGFSEEDLSGFADSEESPKEDKPRAPKLCPHCLKEI